MAEKEEPPASALLVDEAGKRIPYYGPNGRPSDWKWFEFRSDVFGFTLPSSSKFLAGGIEFTPLRRNILSLRSSKNWMIPPLWGRARVKIAASQWSEALNLAHEGVFRFASDILTFAQGCPVFFRNIKFADSTAVYYCEGWGRVGFTWNQKPVVRIDKTKEFFDKAMGKVSEPGFNDQTRTIEALFWINESARSINATEELRFAMNWLGLETLAFAGRQRKGDSGRPSSSELESLLIMVRRWAKEHKMENGASSRLINRIKEFDSPTPYDQVLRLCSELNIHVEKSELRGIVSTWNKIHHEPWGAVPLLSDVHKNLKAITAKCICAILGMDPAVYLVSM